MPWPSACPPPPPVSGRRGDGVGVTRVAGAEVRAVRTVPTFGDLRGLTLLGEGHDVLAVEEAGATDAGSLDCRGQFALMDPTGDRGLVDVEDLSGFEGADQVGCGHGLKLGYAPIRGQVPRTSLLPKFVAPGVSRKIAHS